MRYDGDAPGRIESVSFWVPVGTKPALIQTLADNIRVEILVNGRQVESRRLCDCAHIDAEFTDSAGGWIYYVDREIQPGDQVSAQFTAEENFQLPEGVDIHSSMVLEGSIKIDALKGPLETARKIARHFNN